MKKIFTLCFCALASVMMLAQNPFSVNLADAKWGFDSGATRPNYTTNTAFSIPANWVAGTATVTSYRPYIYPNGNQGDKADQGHTGRHCLYMNVPNSASRVPVFAMLPTVSDKAMNTLALEFYARTFNSELDVNTSNTVYGDWKIGYITSLSDTIKANFTANVHYACALNLTANWAKYSFKLDTIPNGAYMVIYSDNAEHIRYAYIDDVEFVANTKTPAAPTVTYILSHCTGATGNPTEVDNTEEFEASFTLEAGYDWGTPIVTIGGDTLPDMVMDWEADPAYHAEIDGDEMSLSIITADDINDNVVITITCTEAKAEVIPVPGPATFEEYVSVLSAAGEKYNPWTSDATHYWTSGDYTFSCTRSYSGMMNDGFYAANYSDTTYVSFVDDYKAIPCSGANGSETYASMYYAGSWGGPCSVTCTERTITGMYVTMALNPYLCVLGRGTSQAFANGDYLFLHVSGKKGGMYTGTSADFYLADYRNGKTDVVTDWEWMDLSALGLVDELEFVIYDSQNGAGVGLYCCIDNLGGTAPATGVRNNTTVKATKALINGQVVIIKDNKVYNLLGM